MVTTEQMVAWCDAIEALAKGRPQYRKTPPKDPTGWEPPTATRKTWKKADESRRAAQRTAQPPPVMTPTELASTLRTTPKHLDARLIALGVAPTCRRCGGSGKFSFNLTDGDKCWGCGGRGQVPPSPNEWPETVQRALQAVADGRLDAHIARRAAEARAKNGRKQIMDAWHELERWNGHNRHDYRSVPEDVLRRNDTAVRASRAFDVAVHGADVMRGHKPPPGYQTDWVAADRALSEGLAAIHAATEEAKAAKVR